ncbi:MAG: hypothetical protein DMD67_16825 [Gemmatimonadetes bacterium]|nr:MAG: hypothetical protein DMD67_16825 [Gemmatimonadota bacterium]
MTADAISPEFRRALAGRYVLERRLGRGGMGIVYLAHELRLDRRVAIKLLPPERASQAAARDRFLREARTAAQLSHPGIVPIFAVDEIRDTLVRSAMRQPRASSRKLPAHWRTLMPVASSIGT